MTAGRIIISGLHRSKPYTPAWRDFVPLWPRKLAPVTCIHDKPQLGRRAESNSTRNWYAAMQVPPSSSSAWACLRQRRWGRWRTPFTTHVPHAIWVSIKGVRLSLPVKWPLSQPRVVHGPCACDPGNFLCVGLGSHVGVRDPGGGMHGSCAIMRLGLCNLLQSKAQTFLGCAGLCVQCIASPWPAPSSLPCPCAMVAQGQTESCPAPLSAFMAPAKHRNGPLEGRNVHVPNVPHGKAYRFTATIPFKSDDTSSLIHAVPCFPLPAPLSLQSRSWNVSFRWLQRRVGAQVGWD